MTADEERNGIANVDGTRKRGGARIKAGRFTTSRRSPSPHAQGPVSFTAIKIARHYLRGWFPLIGPEPGYANISPVDFVADALDHIAHADGLDRQAFHLANPKSQRSGEVMNTIAAAAHAPQMSVRIERAQGDPGRLRDPRRRARLHRTDRAVDTVTPSEPWPTRGSRYRGWRAAPPSCGIPGSATSIPICSRTAASKGPSTQDGPNHRRLERHRQGVGGAQDRQGRASRSIRRSIALSLSASTISSTIQLNYLGTIKLIMGLLPHMRDRRSGRIVNVSSIIVQTNPPRLLRTSLRRRRLTTAAPPPPPSESSSRCRQSHRVAVRPLMPVHGQRRP